MVLVISALPALELSKNCVTPPGESLPSGPLSVMRVPFPAVAPFVNCIIPCCVPLISVAATNSCANADSFVMPAPLTINVNVGAAVIVNGLAPALKTMPFTSMLAERKTLVVLEVANVAVSDGPLGMVGGVQFAAWFQSPVAGLVFHVALLAKVLLTVKGRSSNIATITNNNANRRRGRR